MLEIELFDHLAVCIYKMCLQIIYLMYMKKRNLALNNQQWLNQIKTKLNLSILFQNGPLRIIQVHWLSVWKHNIKYSIEYD